MPCNCFASSPPAPSPGPSPALRPVSAGRTARPAVVERGGREAAAEALAVLWTLAGDPGRVHTKSALLDAVWGDTAVGEDALTFQIQALRQTLADDARVRGASRPCTASVPVHRPGRRGCSGGTTRDCGLVRSGGSPARDRAPPAPGGQTGPGRVMQLPLSLAPRHPAVARSASDTW